MGSKGEDSGARLRTYTVYRDALDAPGKYVVRGFTIDPGRDPIPDTNATAIVDTLEQARAAVPEGLYNLRRDPTDDPTVVETWI